MNALKTLVTVSVLVAIVYAAYVVINHRPDTGEGPPGVNFDWNAKLNITPGTQTGAAPALAGGAPDAGMAPPFVPGAAAAPSSPSASPGFAAPPGSGPSAPSVADSFGPLPPSTSPAPPPGEPVVRASAAVGLEPPPPIRSDSPRVLSPPPPSTLGSPGTQDTPVAGTVDDFETFMKQVEDELRSGRLADAHLILSQRYQTAQHTPEQTRRLEYLLDQLAGTVVYSREHLLAPPHRVAPGETLRSIADRCNVPEGLLAKINGLAPGSPLPVGQELKVVQGPFHALVSLSRHELTLVMDDGRYAGRFPIGVGADLGAQEGAFTVRDKTDTSAMGAGADALYGSRWIGLDSRLGLHGTNAPEQIGQDMSQGCIALGQRDIEDLYDILSIGSRVLIRR